MLLFSFLIYIYFSPFLTVVFDFHLLCCKSVSSGTDLQHFELHICSATHTHSSTQRRKRKGVTEEKAKVKTKNERSIANGTTAVKVVLYMGDIVGIVHLWFSGLPPAAPPPPPRPRLLAHWRGIAIAISLLYHASISVYIDHVLVSSSKQRGKSAFRYSRRPFEATLFSDVLFLGRRAYGLLKYSTKPLLLLLFSFCDAMPTERPAPITIPKSSTPHQSATQDGSSSSNPTSSHPQTAHIGSRGSVITSTTSPVQIPETEPGTVQLKTPGLFRESPLDTNHDPVSSNAVRWLAHDPHTQDPGGGGASEPITSAGATAEGQQPPQAAEQQLHRGPPSPSASHSGSATGTASPHHSAQFQYASLPYLGTHMNMASSSSSSFARSNQFDASPGQQRLYSLPLPGIGASSWLLPPKEDTLLHISSMSSTSQPQFGSSPPTATFVSAAAAAAAEGAEGRSAGGAAGLLGSGSGSSATSFGLHHHDRKEEAALHLLGRNDSGSQQRTPSPSRHDGGEGGRDVAQQPHDGHHVLPAVYRPTPEVAAASSGYRFRSSAKAETVTVQQQQQHATGARENNRGDATRVEPNQHSSPPQAHVEATAGRENGLRHASPLPPRSPSRHSRPPRSSGARGSATRGSGGYPPGAAVSGHHTSTSSSSPRRREGRSRDGPAPHPAGTADSPSSPTSPYGALSDPCPRPPRFHSNTATDRAATGSFAPHAALSSMGWADGAGPPQDVSRSSDLRRSWYPTPPAPNASRGVEGDVLLMMPAHSYGDGGSTAHLDGYEVYSLLPYCGSCWFLPQIRPVRPGEPRWQLRYMWNDGLVMTMRGQRVSLRLLNLVVRLLLLLLLWFLLWLVLPNSWIKPGGKVFDCIVLLLLSAVIGGFVCRLVRLPPMVGILAVATVWHNIPTTNYLTAGVSTHTLNIAALFGLTLMLARAGYCISPGVLQEHWRRVLCMAIVPLAAEGVFGGLIANLVMPYDGFFKWAFLQSMVCAVGSPSVILPAVYYMEKRGYLGRRQDRDIDEDGGGGGGEHHRSDVDPVRLIAAASPLELAVGVWVINLILSVVFRHKPVVILCVLVPVQLIGGAMCGVALAFAFHYAVELLKREAERYPDGRYRPVQFRRTMHVSALLFVVLCLLVVLAGYKTKLASGGCITCVAFSATVSNIWSANKRRVLRMHRRRRRRSSSGDGPVASSSSDPDPAAIAAPNTAAHDYSALPHPHAPHPYYKPTPHEPDSRVVAAGRVVATDRARSSPAGTAEGPNTSVSSGEALLHDRGGQPTPPHRKRSPPLPATPAPPGHGGAHHARTPSPPSHPLAEVLEEETEEVEVIEDYQEQKLFLGAWLSFLWDEIMMVVLFAALGCRVNIAEVFNVVFVVKAVSLAVIGMLIRFVTTMAVLHRTPYSWRERVVVSIGFLSRGATQAAMGPLAAVMMLVDGATLWGPGGWRESEVKMKRHTRYAAEIECICAIYALVVPIVSSLGMLQGGVALLRSERHLKLRLSSSQCGDDTGGNCIASEEDSGPSAACGGGSFPNQRVTTVDISPANVTAIRILPPTCGADAVSPPIDDADAVLLQQFRELYPPHYPTPQTTPMLRLSPDGKAAAEAAAAKDDSQRRQGSPQRRRTGSKYRSAAHMEANSEAHRRLLHARLLSQQASGQGSAPGSTSSASPAQAQKQRRGTSPTSRGGRAPSPSRSCSSAGTLGGGLVNFRSDVGTCSVGGTPRSPSETHLLPGPDTPRVADGQQAESATPTWSQDGGTASGGGPEAESSGPNGRSSSVPQRQGAGGEAPLAQTLVPHSATLTPAAVPGTPDTVFKPLTP
eukprot:gene8980-6302_t